MQTATPSVNTALPLDVQIYDLSAEDRVPPGKFGVIRDGRRQRLELVTDNPAEAREALRRNEAKPKRLRQPLYIFARPA